MAEWPKNLTKEGLVEEVEDILNRRAKGLGGHDIFLQLKAELLDRLDPPPDVKTKMSVPSSASFTSYFGWKSCEKCALGAVATTTFLGGDMVELKIWFANEERKNLFGTLLKDGALRGFKGFFPAFTKPAAVLP